jgi:AraC family transcriptional regulator
MKNDQRRDYAERIERVISHLQESNFEEQPPSIERLAGVAALSPFHFHRIFRLMTGETVGEACQRIRLARSMTALAEGAKVTAAGGLGGYGSSQSFAKALRRETGRSATELRADGRMLDEVLGSLSKPFGSATGAPLAITVQSIAPFRLLAIRNVGDYAELNQAYGRLFDLVLEQVAPDALQGIWGVPYDDPRFVAAKECRFACALATGEQGNADGALRELTLGGGDHLVLRHLGDYDRLHDRIDALYAAMIGMGREAADAPLFIHYLDDPEEVAEADLRSDILLPLA